MALKLGQAFVRAKGIGRGQQVKVVEIKHTMAKDGRSTISRYRMSGTYNDYLLEADVRRLYEEVKDGETVKA